MSLGDLRGLTEQRRVAEVKKRVDASGRWRVHSGRIVEAGPFALAGRPPKVPAEESGGIRAYLRPTKPAW
jgi:hypothetical protein